MLKKILLSLAAGLMIGSVAQAQHVHTALCGSDHHHEVLKNLYPEILQNEIKLEAFIKNYLNVLNLSKADPTNLNDTLHIPVVVHVVHDGGSEFVDDAAIYTMMDNINKVYLKLNADTAQVIPTFKPYIGKANIMFHLAKKDPLGQPTKGIVRYYTYLSANGNNQAKIGQWAPNRYLNIWVVKSLGISQGGGTTLAYAMFPTGAAAAPHQDGILSGFPYLNNDKTIEHEIGHYLNLAHTWGNGEVATACGDDEVDDTPPTKGHFSTCPLYDTACLNFDASIGKLRLDTPAFRTVTDTLENKSIEFTTRSRVLIKSVTIYPGLTTPIGSPFQIQLRRKGGPVLATYNDTIKQGTANLNFAQIVPVNFMIQNWDTTNGFEMVLTQNPGLRRDTTNTFIVSDVFGVMNLKKVTDDTLYNYFYDWKLTHYYFAQDPNNFTQIIDYPDTVNTQNIMDYSSCTHMFTKGQVLRMRAALNSNIAFRSNLWDSTNLIITGALEPRQDLAPIAEFAVMNQKYYVCANGVAAIQLKDVSWNDTISSRTWSFSNGVTANNTSAQVINVTSTQPGWATVTLTANSNSGTNTINKQNIYFADPNPTSVVNYYQEFGDAATNDKWPIFNPYENDYKWKINNNTGFYDKSSIMFTGFDNRTFPNSAIGFARGDVDEFYSPVMDMTTMPAGPKFMNFMYAGAYRTTQASQMRDSFVVYYSTNCGISWVELGKVRNQEIATVGTLTSPFEPLSMSDWKAKSIQLPTAVANSSSVMFRFRYFSNPISFDPYNSAVLPTSNNFYVDRIHFREWSMSAAELALADKKVAIAPNPTMSNATVFINLGHKQQQVQVNVLDVTGKLVYSTAQQVGGQQASIDIPASALTVKGVYMVQVIADGNMTTERLVVK